MEDKNNDPFVSSGDENVGESHLIEQLEKKLYSRQDEIKHKERTVLHPKKFGTTEEWGGSLDYKKPGDKVALSPYVKFFLFSLIFFVIAAGIAGYSLFSKRAVISPENVTLSLFGPVSLKGGEELSIQALIENKNSVSLNLVQITTDFPAGSRFAGNSGEKLTRSVKKLNDIDAHEVRTEIIKAVLLGEENEKKEISLTIRFRIEGSNAVYTKTKKFIVNLTVSPLTFSVTSEKETIAGQEIVIGAEVKSNSPAPLKNSLFKIDYPQGFVFKSAKPAPSFGDNIWFLGDMKLGDTKTLEIKGVLLGENDQQKVFHLSAGSGTEKDKLTIGTLFETLQTIVTIKKPFLGVAIFVNRSNGKDLVVNDWKSVDANIQITNSLQNKIIDGEVEVSLAGDIIDQRSVIVGSEGLYDSFKNTIFWDKRAYEPLASLSPGEKNSVQFSFALLPFSAEKLFKNPEITLTASVKGKRIDENNVPEEIKLFVTRKIKVSTEMEIASLGTYYTGPIQNSGPLPPKVGKETTYTVTWKMKNSANDISDAAVSAEIPLSVRFTGKVFPSGAPVAYDSTSNRVTWNIGDVKAWTGYTDEPKEVSFQIALLPGLSQRNRSPELLSEAILTATDDFTGASLSTDSDIIMTILSGVDPKIKQTDAVVVE
jgi:hypothetical protein